MREMTDGTTTLNITRHIITQNFWEYYVTDQKFNNRIVQCLVIGDFTELGDVNLDEIRPYIMTSTENLNGIMPAPGWRWGD